MVVSQIIHTHTHKPLHPYTTPEWVYSLHGFTVSPLTQQAIIFTLGGGSPGDGAHFLVREKLSDSAWTNALEMKALQLLPHQLPAQFLLGRQSWLLRNKYKRTSASRASGEPRHRLCTPKCRSSIPAEETWEPANIYNKPSSLGISAGSNPFLMSSFPRATGPGYHPALGHVLQHRF